MPKRRAEKDTEQALKELGKSNAGSPDGIVGITAKDALTIQLYKTGLAKLD